MATVLNPGAVLFVGGFLLLHSVEANTFKAKDQSLLNYEEDLLTTLFQQTLVDRMLEAIRHGGNASSTLTDQVTATGFKPCKKSDPPFSFSYRPEVLSKGGTITVDCSFTPRISLSSGRVCATAKWAVIKKKMCKDFSCADVNQYAQGYCPFTSGERVELRDRTFPIPKWSQMINEDQEVGIKITPKIEVDIKDNSGRTFLCAKGKLKIKW